MATMWLARHAETTWNLAGRYQGRMESALSGLGVRQGFALAEAFFARAAKGAGKPARIVASPLLRCVATARFVAARLDVPVEVDERLIEIAHGTWDGRYRDALKREDPQRYRAWRHDPAHVSFERGESLGDVLARWRAFAGAWATQPHDTLVVTHDAVVRCALVDATARPLDDFWKVRVENAAFATLANDGEHVRLVDECDATHLAGMRADIEQQAL